MEKAKIKAVLFDLDGTLNSYDTDWKGLEAQARKFAAKCGIVIEKEHISDVFAEIRAKIRREKDGKEYLRMLQEYENELIDDGKSRLCNGARDLVRKVKLARMKTAIVSNNMHESTLRILEQHGLREYFDQVICWDDVIEPKPSPEGINEALRRLKVKPDEALFVGDGRRTDLVAAEAAGVECMIVESGKISDEKERILGRIRA